MTARRAGPVLLRPVEDGGADIGDWFCVTVVRPRTDPLDDTVLHPETGARDGGDQGWAARAWLLESVRRLGGDPGALAAWDRSPDALQVPADDLDAAGTVLASLVVPPGAPGPRAVVLLEVAGCEGSRPQVLRALSEGAEVHSLFCGVHRDVVSYAVDGRLLVAFDPAEPDVRWGDEPDVLGRELQPLAHAVLLEDLDALDDLVLALLARRTGAALDAAWWQGEHLLTRVVPVPDETPVGPPVLPAAVVALGERAAADPRGPDADVLLATLQDAARAALHLTGLVDDPEAGAPLAQAVAEAGLLRRMALDGDPTLEHASLAAHGRISRTVAALWDAYRPSGAAGAPVGTGRPGAPAREDDPLWQRLQAAMAVTELLVWAVAPSGPQPQRRSPQGVLLHVRFALADRWPAFEDALVAHVHATAGP